MKKLILILTALFVSLTITNYAQADNQSDLLNDVPDVYCKEGAIDGAAYGKTEYIFPSAPVALQLAEAAGHKRNLSGDALRHYVAYYCMALCFQQ